MMFMDPGSGVTVTAPLEAQTGIDLSGGDLTLTGSGQIFAMGGCDAVPGYAFSNDADSGMYLVGAGVPGFVASGIAAFRIQGSAGTSPALMAENLGAESRPVYSFTGGTNTGMFLTGGGELAFSHLGSTMVEMVNGSSVNILAPLQALVGLDLAGGDLTLSGSGRLLIHSGCQTLPGIADFDDPDTGIQLIASQIVLTTGGTNVLQIFNNRIRSVQDGTELLPAYTFSNDSNSGMYSSGANELAFSASGVQQIRIVQGGVVSSTCVYQGIEACAAGPTFSWRADPDTGMFLDQVARIGFGVSASTIMTITSSVLSAVLPGTDLGADLGSSTLQWNQVWASAVRTTLLAGASTIGWNISASGHLIPTTAELQDIGSSAIPIRSLFITGSTFILNGDSVISKDAGVLVFGGSVADVRVSATNTVDIVSGSTILLTPTVAVDIASGDLTFTGLGQILAPTSTSAAPAYAFGSDLDTGMFASTGFLRIVAGGTAGMEMVTGQVRFTPGTVAAPGISFKTETNAGIAHAAGSALHLVIGGSSLLRVTTGSAVVATAVLHAATGIDLIGGDLTLSGSGQIVTANGSAGFPAIRMPLSGSGAGFFAALANQVAYSSGSAIVFRMGVGDDALFSSTHFISLADGLVTTPTYTFAADPDTGMYSTGVGVLALAASGVQVLRASNNSVVIAASQFLVQDGTTSLPGFAFEADIDTGIFRLGNNIMGLAVATSTMIQIDAGSSVTIVAPLRVQGGLVASPAIAFASDPDTGIYSAGGNQLGFVANGVQQFVATTTAISFRRQVLASSGTVGVPSYSFSNDADSGMYLPTTGQVGFAASGVQVVRLLSSQLLIQPDGSAGAPAIAFGTDTDTGMFQGAGATISFAVNAVEKVSIGTNDTIFQTRIRALDGSSATPGIAFACNTNTGMFRPAGNELGFAVGGSLMFKIDNGSSITAFAPIHPEADVTHDLGTASLRWNFVYASTVVATRLEGSVADVAERYHADRIYEAATVMIFGGSNQITESYQMNDTRVAGVISTEPFIRMNAKAGNDDTHPFLGLRGAVPCKVKGPVSKGDLITTSDTPGYGQAATELTPHWAVFAKSLEDLDGSAIIEVVV
jgi:hypothetical protein